MHNPSRPKILLDMLLIVVGAGASFDSDPRRRANGPATLEGNRPPLADQLFDDRELFSQMLRQFPGCQPIIPYLHDRNGRSIEEMLAILQDEKSAHRASQLAAIRWYLRMMIGICTERWYAETYGVLNHKTLLDQIEHHGRPYDGVCIVTFNYDCLIERALESVNVTISDFNSYTRDDRYKLFKLHGSINWRM